MVIQVEPLNLSIKDYRRPAERCYILESLYTRPHGGSFQFYQDFGTEVGKLMSVPGTEQSVGLEGLLSLLPKTESAGKRRRKN
jgi:hypothetical protein